MTVGLKKDFSRPREVSVIRPNPSLRGGCPTLGPNLGELRKPTLSKLQNRFQNRRITEGRLIIDQTLLQGGCLTLDQTLGDLLLISLLLGLNFMSLPISEQKVGGCPTFGPNSTPRGVSASGPNPFVLPLFVFYQNI